MNFGKLHIDGFPLISDILDIFQEISDEYRSHIYIDNQQISYVGYNGIRRVYCTTGNRFTSDQVL